MAKIVATCGLLAAFGVAIVYRGGLQGGRQEGVEERRRVGQPNSATETATFDRFDADEEEGERAAPLLWQSDDARLYAQGRLEGARPHSELRPAVTGRVVQRFVSAGEQVTAGQPLLLIDPAHCERQVELAAAQWQAAVARLQRVENGPTSHDRDELQALAQAKTAELEHGRLLQERISKLAQAQAVSRQEADDQMAKLATLVAEASAAQARVDRLATEPRADDVAIASADVTAAEARLEVARAELDRQTLRSPIDGLILQAAVELGEIVGPQSVSAAFVVADTSRFRIRAYVEELDAPRVAVGMHSVARIDGLPDQELRGRIAYVSPRMGSKQVWADRPNERHDAKAREVLVELDPVSPDLAANLVLGLRVDLFIDASTP